MRSFVWFLASLVFVLTAFATRISVAAAENSKLIETVEKTESFLDEKQASSLYLGSKFPDFAASENDKLFKDTESLKDEVLKDPNLTKESRLGISRQLIKSLVNLGKHKEALELCENFSDKYPERKGDITELYFLTGYSCQEQNKYDQAIEAYRQAFPYSSRKDNFANHIRINLGWCYYKIGKYDEAINEYNSTLKKGSLDPATIQWAWFQIGRCRFFLKNYEDAIEAFRQALNVNPDTVLARQAKANIEDIEKFKKGETS